MYQEIINKTKLDFDKAIEHFKTEIATLRTGRATPALVEDVEVECYGSRMPLKQLAAIHAPEPRMIIIQPWDKGVIKDIERAIVTFRPGLNPIVDGNGLRINMPALTEERRRELVKLLNGYLEKSRIALRQYRDEAWKEVQALEESGKLREDDKFRAKDDLQKTIDQYNAKVKEIGEAKEKEIMTV